ncbi:tautomerase family protein [Dactylosporangium darangshiense]|jgi:hypothetical protein|uniref:Tautomerase family protein n=1 Tax=Dactylosporangium darangshiense TaxID=579108 RepID=A0ABP8DQ98_9ACTN|nr:tautomerase family protein [Dactylosporangium sp.]
MPLIQVHLDRAVFTASQAEIGDAIHDAQVEVLGIPADDRFQIFLPHDAGELKFDPGYNGVDRRSLLVVRIVAVRMYDTQTKHHLFRAIADKLAPLGIRPEDLLVCLTENGAEDWYAGKL